MDVKVLLGVAALLAAAAACGARTDLVGQEPFRCADGSRAGPVGCDRVTFADAVSHPVAVGLKQVHVADVSGDGALDIVVVGGDVDPRTGDVVTVLLNRGDGVFSEGVDYAMSFTSPYQPAGGSDVSAGDLNQDGAVDLVVSPARDDATSVSVLLNDGDGAFAPGVPYAVGVGPGAVALGDLNDDGLLDIATANLRSNDVSVLSNRGDGTFAAPVTHGPVPTPNGITVADLDLDGRLDIAATVVPFIPLGIGFFWNAGGGAFEGPVVQPDFGAHEVVVGDVNGDGWPDLASDHIHDIDVRLNLGGKRFGDTVHHPVAPNSHSVAMADLNGDCRPDLATAYQGGGSWVGGFDVLLNIGEGTFGPADAHVLDGAYSVAAGDLNGDGKVDLAVTYVSLGMVSVMLNRGCEP